MMNHIIMRHFILLISALFMTMCSPNNTPQAEGHDGKSESAVLKPDLLEKQVTYFNQMEAEDVVSFVSNEEAAHWLANSVPLFECPDSVLEQMYYFRWWTFRKHLKETPDGFVFTEFIRPVKHDGKYNTISCALGHQIYEGRWLHDDRYLDDYIVFWLIRDKFEEHPHAHQFSSWLADAVYHRYLVNQDETFLISLIDELDKDYRQWEQERKTDQGLFWQYDVRDGMEESISGSRRDKNLRPTINSYMYGNAKAIAKIAAMIQNEKLQKIYKQKADSLKMLVQQQLWDNDAHFFKVKFEKGGLSDAREAIGYIPWYFELPDDTLTYGKAWEEIRDPEGFSAPYGLTTAEQRHPEFRSHGTGGCEWDGAVWPFATTQTLKGLATLINRYEQHNMTRQDYFDALATYAKSQYKNGKPYIGEYQDEKTGYWLKGDNPRSRYYNHSGFCDLIINDLVGLKPQPDNKIVVQPLVPENTWDWFCLDQVKYHDHLLTIIWDKTGEKYRKGKGFSIWADGVEIARSDDLSALTGELPSEELF